jgi:hypothetical protein
MYLPINLERTTPYSSYRKLAALRRGKIPYRVWVGCVRQDLCDFWSAVPGLVVSFYYIQKWVYKAYMVIYEVACEFTLLMRDVSKNETRMFRASA